MVLLVASALVYFLYYIFKFSFFTIDDAYIHFRVARNIAEHGLPYYNIDEKVMGSSPHLWINFIAALFKVSNSNLSWIPYYAWTWTAGSFFCARHLLLARFKPISSTLLAFLLVTIFLLPTAAGLMEQPLVITLFLFTLILFQKEKSTWAGFFAALCLWVRPEFAVFTILGFFLAKTKSRLGYALAASVPTLAYVIYAYYYFGTLFPLPMISKPIVFSVSWTEFFTNLPTAHSYTLRWRHLWPAPLKALCIAMAFTTIYGILFYQAWKQRAVAWIKLSLYLSCAIFLAYCYKRLYLFPWYIPHFAFPLGLAATLLLTRKTVFVGLLFLAIACFNTFYIAATNSLSLVTGETKYYDEAAVGWRIHQYLKIGEELYSKKPNAVLLTSEIGALSWTFKGKIVDGAALISPSALQYHPMAVPQDRPWPMAAGIPYQVVQDWKPDFIVSLPIFSVAVRREVDSGLLPYTLVKYYPPIPTEESVKMDIYRVWTSDRIDIFERH